MNVWLERGYIIRSGLVVPLASVRFASRFGNSFWSEFYSHNFNVLTRVRDKRGLKRRDSDADKMSGDHGRGRLIRF